MKFSQIGRVALASVVSLAACVGISACTTAYTGAYLYVTSTKANPGVVTAFKVDSVSGALYQLPDSPFPAGRNPVGLVVSPNRKYVYVINHDDSTVLQYTIGTDGKLYAYNTYNIVGGSLPISIAIDPTGQFLLVAFTYQQGYTPASPGPGGVDVFPINSDGTLVATASTGSAPGVTFVPVGCNPISIQVASANNFVYVLDQNYSPSPATCVASSSTPAGSPIANAPLVLGFSLDVGKTQTGGQLTPLPGSSVAGVAYPGYLAGVQPSSLIVDPKSQFAYVADEASNAIYSYAIQANGSLAAVNLTSAGVAPAAITQVQPVALAFSDNGNFLFDANFGSNNVGEFAVGPNGSLTAPSTASTLATGTNPTCIALSSHGQFLFATNYTSNSVSAFELDSTTGAAVNIQNSPFGTAGLPTCAAAVTATGH